MRAAAIDTPEVLAEIDGRRRLREAFESPALAIAFPTRPRGRIEDWRDRVKTSIKLKRSLWLRAKVLALEDSVDLSTVVSRALERYVGRG